MSLIIECYHHYSNRVWILVEIEMENRNTSDFILKNSG